MKYKFKFMDKVVIVEPEFYKGSSGVVVYYDQSEQKYEVQFELGVRRSFFPDQLNKATGKGRK